MKLVSLVPINSTPDPSMIRISSANLVRSRRWGNAVPLNTDTPNRTFIISPSGGPLHDQPEDDRLDATVVSLRGGDNACPSPYATAVCVSCGDTGRTERGRRALALSPISGAIAL